MESQKEGAIGSMAADIGEPFGNEVIMRRGADHPRPVVGVISTGALRLDIARGTGGVPHPAPRKVV